MKDILIRGVSTCAHPLPSKLPTINNKEEDALLYRRNNCLVRYSREDLAKIISINDKLKDNKTISTQFATEFSLVD